MTVFTLIEYRPSGRGYENIDGFVDSEFGYCFFDNYYEMINRIFFVMCQDYKDQKRPYNGSLYNDTDFTIFFNGLDYEDSKLVTDAAKEKFDAWKGEVISKEEAKKRTEAVIAAQKKDIEEKQLLNQLLAKHGTQS